MRKNSKNFWNEEKIEEKILYMVGKTKQTTFPTHTEINDFFGDYRLSNAIRRHGGTKYWAQKTGMEIKNCESKFGDCYEEKFMDDVLRILDFQSDRCKVRYPYDVLVEGVAKVDVKSSNRIFAHGFQMYTCNLEKDYQTCDFYVVYCINGENLDKVYVLPSFLMTGKTQFSVGVMSSKYDVFIDRWDLIKDYVEFVKESVIK